MEFFLSNYASRGDFIEIVCSKFILELVLTFTVFDVNLNSI